MQPDQSVIPVWDQAPPMLNWAEKIAYLAAAFATMPQTEAPLTHSFEPGVYIRTLRVPAGVLILGNKHRLGHTVELLEGQLVLITEGCKHPYSAPAKIITQPGFYAVCFTITDVLVQTRHPNPSDSTDLAALDAENFEPRQALIDRGLALHGRVSCQVLQ